MGLFDERDHYKPFSYPWAFEAYDMQQKIHWIPAHQSLQEDVKCWNHVLNAPEKNLLTQLFRFFPQADIDVAGGYVKHFIPLFPAPELRMMLLAFAAMEGVHIHAYALLLDTIGMPETEYKAFKEYEVMRDKHEYWQKLNPVAKFEVSDYDDPSYKQALQELALTIATASTFGEGLQLFGTFAILMNFPRHKKMTGMAKIVEWSIRDESLHVEAMLRLFHTLIDENPQIWTNQLKGQIYQACRNMVALEFKFIDLAFEQGGIENLTPDEVKQYIKYLADRRLLQLGLKPEYKVKKNPLEWMDELLNLDHHANFFETTSTEYSDGGLTGSWEDVWKNLEAKAL